MERALILETTFLIDLERELVRVRMVPRNACWSLTRPVEKRLLAAFCVITVITV